MATFEGWHPTTIDVPMPPAFKPWDIVKVPFPYTDRPARERLFWDGPGIDQAIGELA